MNPYNTADALRPSLPEQVEFQPINPQEVERARAAIKRHRERQNREDEKRRAVR